MFEAREVIYNRSIRIVLQVHRIINSTYNAFIIHQHYMHEQWAGSRGQWNLEMGLNISGNIVTYSNDDQDNNVRYS